MTFIAAVQTIKSTIPDDPTVPTKAEFVPSQKFVEDLHSRRYAVVELCHNCREDPAMVRKEFLKYTMPDLATFFLDDHQQLREEHNEPYMIHVVNDKKNQAFLAFIGSDCSDTTFEFCRSNNIPTNGQYILIQPDKSCVCVNIHCPESPEEERHPATKSLTAFNQLLRGVHDNITGFGPRSHT